MLLVDGIHHNIAPVDCLDVAEGQVLLNLHPALEDVDEAVEAHRLHVLHLIDGQGVVLDQLVVTDYSQPKDKGKGFTLYTVYHCFGSGSGSARIRIKICLLDPDPDPGGKNLET